MILEDRSLGPIRLVHFRLKQRMTAEKTVSFLEVHLGNGKITLKFSILTYCG
ncbi:hypothetical protein WN55_03360 [Dufourea novaeangliae]|uniref:Uncharacterized protein n=1 Tax=Dufourea novaeangliae TaxID=178035 RepID=A0A154PLH3_DUFNO|nr:hypothetical protein WN55_03360 [Dufourea novaeangliae]